jgi:hypothetical protein
MYKSNFYKSIICYICKEKGYDFAYLRKFEVRKSQKRLGPQIAKIRDLSHLRKIRKSNKLFKGAQVWDFDLLDSNYFLSWSLYR